VISLFTKINNNLPLCSLLLPILPQCLISSQSALFLCFCLIVSVSVVFLGLYRIGVWESEWLGTEEYQMIIEIVGLSCSFFF